MSTTFISFSQWLALNKEDFLVDEVPCRQCRGSGGDTCRCCGSDIDCPRCEGTGAIKTDGKTMVDEVAARIEYNAMVERDKKLAAVWGMSVEEPAPTAPA